MYEISENKFLHDTNFIYPSRILDLFSNSNKSYLFCIDYSNHF